MEGVNGRYQRFNLAGILFWHLIQQAWRARGNFCFGGKGCACKILAAAALYIGASWQAHRATALLLFKNTSWPWPRRSCGPRPRSLPKQLPCWHGWVLTLIDVERKKWAWCWMLREIVFKILSGWNLYSQYSRLLTYRIASPTDQQRLAGCSFTTTSSLPRSPTKPMTRRSHCLSFIKHLPDRDNI